MSVWINYHHLFYFKTIAEEGSVSKAAIKLSLGQPTLSAQLSQFEKSLGVPLFERQHKKLILTDQGKVALEYARQIFSLGTEMYETLHNRLVPAKLSVRIGVVDSVAKQITLKLVKAAHRIAPCLVSLAEGRSDELIRELATHRLDLLLTNFIPTATDSKALLHRVVASANVSIFAAPSFKKLRKGFPHSLSGRPILMPTYDNKLRYDLDHWREALGIELNVIAESQDIAVKKLMAINGMAMIPTTPHTVARQVRSGELIELGKLQGVYEDLLIATAERKIINPVASRLLRDFRL